MYVMQAEVESSSKDLRMLERTLQVQDSDLKALKHQLDEKDTTVRCHDMRNIVHLPCIHLVNNMACTLLGQVLYVCK